MRPPRRAFSMVELLVVMVVFAVLATIMLPVLGRVRKAGVEAAASANIRSHAAIMLVYTGDWRGTFPYFTDPRRQTTPLQCGERIVQAAYFDAVYLWPCALAPGYYENKPSHPSFKAPGHITGDNPYKYSLSMIAHPDFWHPGTRRGPSQWLPTNIADVRYTELKGMLVSWANAYTRPGALDFTQPRLRFEVGFCDGSSASVRYTDFVPPVPNGTGPVGPDPTSTFGQPVIHTLYGVRGRDLLRR